MLKPPPERWGFLRLADRDHEGGGIAFNAGCQARTLPGDLGRLTASSIEAAVNPDDLHRPPTSLVCLENTVNRGGGSCYDQAGMQAIRKVCDRRGLRLHLTGQDCLTP